MRSNCATDQLHGKLRKLWGHLGRVFLHIILPLGIGILIYIFWRSPTLKIFVWLDVAGLSSEILRTRQWVYPYGEVLPKWIIFSLPAALWMYAMVSWFQMALLPSDRQSRWIWLSAAFILGVGSEVGQLFQTIPGIFDSSDVTLYIIGWMMAIFSASQKEAFC